MDKLFSVRENDLPIETVRRLCCDSAVVTLSENKMGDPLHVGRQHRMTKRLPESGSQASNYGASPVAPFDAVIEIPGKAILVHTLHIEGARKGI